MESFGRGTPIAIERPDGGLKSALRRLDEIFQVSEAFVRPMVDPEKKGSMVLTF